MIISYFSTITSISLPVIPDRVVQYSTKRTLKKKESLAKIVSSITRTGSVLLKNRFGEKKS
jgi:hypothetical protein